MINKPLALKRVHWINIILILITFGLNFIGSPLMKYHYLLHVIFGLGCVLFFNFEEILPEIITFFFVEGQGKIVWEYQSWARIIFDLTLTLLVMRGIIRRKRIMDVKSLPIPILIFIVLHFFWFVIQIFNTNGLNSLSAVASSKMYIFPILLFLNLQFIEISEKEVRNVVYISLFLLSFEGILLVFQSLVKESHMLAISRYYDKAMKGDIFTGAAFRPFATTNLPGGFSSFYFLTIGLLFLKKLNFKLNLVQLFIVLLSLYCMFISHVRSAFVKYLLIIFVIQLGHLIFHRLNLKKLLMMVIWGLIMFGIGSYVFFTQLDDVSEEVEVATKRFSNLGSLEKVQKARISPTEFIEIFTSKLEENPLGRGPGLTGAASSLTQQDIKDDPLLDRANLWAYDSFIISLVIDLGVGLFFYLGLIFYLMYYLFKGLIAKYVSKDEFHFKIILASFASMVVILIGNWGAIGLTYNPESFMFWLYAGLATSSIKENKGHDRAVASSN